MDAPYSFSMQQYQQEPLLVMHAGASAGALNSHRLSPSVSESGLSSQSSAAGLKAMHNNSTAHQSPASAGNTGGHSTAASHTATASFSAWKLTAAPDPSGEAGQGQGLKHGGCCAERSWSRSSGGEQAYVTFICFQGFGFTDIVFECNSRRTSDFKKQVNKIVLGTATCDQADPGLSTGSTVCAVAVLASTNGGSRHAIGCALLLPFLSLASSPV